VIALQYSGREKCQNLWKEAVTFRDFAVLMAWSNFQSNENNSVLQKNWAQLHAGACSIWAWM